MQIIAQHNNGVVYENKQLIKCKKKMDGPQQKEFMLFFTEMLFHALVCLTQGP